MFSKNSSFLSKSCFLLISKITHMMVVIETQKHVNSHTVLCNTIIIDNFHRIFLFLCEHNPCESRVWFSFGFSSLAFSHHHGDFLHHPFSMVFICLTLGQVLLLLGILHLVKNSSTVSTWSPKRIVNRYCSCNLEVPKPLFLL